MPWETNVELFIFAVFALLALASAAGVILLKNPVHSAISLLVALCGVAALFALLMAEFLAVVQLLVYAGGVMVLFLFVIMLVDLEQRGLDREAGRIAPRPSIPARISWSVLALITAGGLGWILSRAAARPGPAPAALDAALRGGFGQDGRVLGNIEQVGQLLFTQYLLPFELASVLLLVAMVGATVLARKLR